MAFQIDDIALDERLDRLADAQPVKASRKQMVISLLTEACAVFERTGDAEAWRTVAPSHPNGAQQNRGSNGSVNHQPNDTPKGEIDIQPPASGDIA